MGIPKLKPKTTAIVPIHFPKIKPARRSIGDPKPSNKTQTIVNKINNKQTPQTYVKSEVES